MKVFSEYYIHWCPYDGEEGGEKEESQHIQT